MADHYRDLVRLLKEHGYEFKRQGRRDHESWWNPRTGVRFTVDRKGQLQIHRKRNSQRGWSSESLLTRRCAKLAAGEPPPW